MEGLDRLRRKLSVVHVGEIFAQGQVQSSGVTAFDECMNGGLPEGKVIELYGDFSSGKSLLLYHAIAELQKEGGIPVLIDTEDALNAEWARSIGISLEDMIYISPINVEEEVTIEFVFKELEEFVKAWKADDEIRQRPAIFAWDSVAATKSKEEGEGMDYKPEMAVRARVISQMMRKVPSLVAGTKIIVIFVNQLRDKVGVMYGAKEDTPGGRAIKFHSHLRLKMKKGQKIWENKVCTGVMGEFSVEKSKVGRPFRFANFHMTFENGIEKYSGMKDLLIREGRAVVAGSGWAKIGDFRFRDVNEEIWEQIKGLEVQGGENANREGEEGSSSSEEEQSG